MVEFDARRRGRGGLEGFLFMAPFRRILVLRCDDLVPYFVSNRALMGVARNLQQNSRSTSRLNRG